MTIYKKNFVFRLIVFVFFGFFLAGKNNCVLAQNPDQSLVGWWRFDGESGESQTLFKDSSAFGNNAICRDNSCPVLVNGKFGKALRFDGVDDYLEIANSFSLENITESSFTWSAWYRPDNPPPDDIAPFEGYHVRQALICKEGWHTAISYGNNSLFHAELRAADNTPYWLDSPSSYTAQAWHYLSLSADSASKVLTLYVDGQAVKSMPYSGTSREYNQNPLKIGGCSAPGRNYDWLAKGIIDDVRIYNRALVGNEIMAIFKNIPLIATYVAPAITNNKILPDIAVSDSYKLNNISISAAKGEYEPASFVVISDQAINGLVVEPVALTGQGGVIPAANVDIKAVKVWWQAGYPWIGDTTHKQLVPELLLNNDSLVRVDKSDNHIKLSDGREIKISDPAGIQGVSDNPTNTEFPVQDSQILLPVSMEANRNKQFWVTVKIPDNISDGKYAGKIYLKNGGQILKEIDLSVNVLPFKLSKPKLEYSIYTMTDLSSGTIGVGRNFQQYKTDMANILSHGIENPNIQGNNKAFFNEILTARAQSGMSNETIYWNYLINWLSDADIAAVKSQASAAGVKNFYIYLPDEADLTTPENQTQIKRAHDNGFRVFDAQNQNQSAVANQLDLLISALEPNAALAAEYHSFGHKIFSYGNPQSGQETPETYRRNYGLLLWQKDYDGAMDFAYYWAGSGNVWNDFDDIGCQSYPWCFRDHNMVYPTVDGVIDTIQWEGFREGVDDVRYLSTLLDRVAYAKTKGINTSAIENWLADLKQSNLATQNLDNIRSQMASYIVGLPDPGVAICAPKTCAALGNYQCGGWSDGCGNALNCGACAGGKTCNASGQCVSQTTGGPAVSGSDPQTLAETPQQLTRAEILQKIAEVKQLLIQLIIQLIAELQKQLAALPKMN